MRYTVDRFEEDFAILEAEDRTLLQVSKADLPCKTTEGSRLQQINGSWHLIRDTDTAARIGKKMDSLWK